MRRLTIVLSVGAGLLALLGSAPSAAQDDPRWADAEARYGEAETLYERGDYEAALAEFVHIHELLENHPRRFFVLFNIGRCQERLFRYDEALASYQRYLADGQVYARSSGESIDREAEARQLLRDLDGRLATLRIATNVDRAEVWVDDRVVGTAPGDVRVVAGRHAVQLRAPGHTPAQQDVQIAARTTQPLSFTLDAAFAGLSPAFFVTGAALTLAALAVGIGFGSAALAEQSSIDAQLASSDPTERFRVTQARIDANAETALVADILYGAAGALGIASVILFFVTDWGSAPESERARLEIMPWAAPQAAGMVLGGSF